MTIVFQNSGVVPLDAFTTFGISAKPGSTNPIGKFGTGLKYAVAVTLRLGGEFRLWRGEDEYVFYTREEDFRGKTFAKVRMRHRSGLLSRWRYTSLPFTTELGKHWEPWMALRELEANCRDEGGESYEIGTDGPLQFLPRDGHTTISVSCPEIEDEFARITEMFLPQNDVPIYEDSRVRIFDRPSAHVYYRGMRITDLRKHSVLTYELKTAELTEDRTSRWPWYDNTLIRDTILACDDMGIVTKVRDAAGRETFESTLSWDEVKKDVSTQWTHALRAGGLPSRLAALRDNLDYGIGKSVDVDVTLSVAQWEHVLLHVHGDTAEEIRRQLTESGWREKMDKTAEVDVLIVHTTADAILVALEDESEGAWIPRQALKNPEDEFLKGDTTTIVISQTLAEEKGLV